MRKFYGMFSLQNTLRCLDQLKKKEYFEEFKAWEVLKIRKENRSLTDFASVNGGKTNRAKFALCMKTL